jgi:branched-chain amino acid transport system permease protein
MSKAKTIALGLLILLLIALPWLVNPYVLQIVISTITYSMLGLAFAFTLRVGLPRFDITAWWAIGAYTTTTLMLKTNMSFWLTLPIAGLVAVILGWLVFAIVIPRGMMVFLMFGMVLALATQQFFGAMKFFGAWGGTGIVPQPTLGPFTFANKPELYFLGLILLIINLLVYYALFNSKIGRAWNAIGSSLKLASSVGVDIVKYRMANVLIGNFFLAIAGSYLVAYTLCAVPTTFSFMFSVYVMMYVVVGGLAYSLTGPLIGSTVITFLPEYLRVAKEYETIITGVATILIIIFMPMGILGLIDQRVRLWLVRRKWYARLTGGPNG